MNSEINRFEAIAATICLASLRVYGRKKCDVRKKIIDKYGTKGGKTCKIYREYLVNY